MANHLWGAWVSALAMVLLSAHEIGHLSVAQVRGVRLRPGAVLVPGFIRYSFAGRPPWVWDEVAVICAGPLLGGAVGLAAKLIGRAWDWPTLGMAGDICLVVAALQVTPFWLTDGGRLLRRTPWLGASLCLLSFGYPILFMDDLSTKLMNALLCGLVLLSCLGGPPTRWYSQVGVCVMATALFIGLLFISSDPVPNAPESFGWMSVGSGFYLLILTIFAAWLLPVLGGLVAWRHWLPALVAGRPTRLLLRAGLAMRLPIRPGLAWLIRSCARRGWLVAGLMTTAGYAALAGQRSEVAQRWLDDLTPALNAGGPAALILVFNGLLRQGYGPLASPWLIQVLGSPPPDALPPRAAHALAYAHLAHGQPGLGLAYAHAAVARADRDGTTWRPEDHAAVLATLGETLLALGQPHAAEVAFRQALDNVDHPIIRLNLARALAAYDNYDQAIAEASDVFRRHVGRWPSAYGDRSTISWEIAGWRDRARVREAA
jgi:hypothetical protein